MSPETLNLVTPAAELREAFLAMKAEYKTVNDRHKAISDLYRQGPAETDFAHYLQSLAQSEQGMNLKPGYVPGSTFWLVCNGTAIVGVSHLRHKLTPTLEYEGGHIGYNIRPSKRGKGYGTPILRLTLEQAKARGLKRVLLTCDTDNIASARVIEKNGGRFENEVISHQSGKQVSRYWIVL